MVRKQSQIAPTVHVHEETFGASDTLTFQSYFKVTNGLWITVKKATATALLFAWSRSGNVITIKASASSSETISILENGR